MNRFDSVACSFVSHGRNAHRLPEGGLIVEVAQGEEVVTAFYSPTETQVVQTVSRSHNGATIDEPQMRTIAADNLDAAKRMAEDLAIRDMKRLMS